MKVKFLPIKKQLTALAALLVGFPGMLALVGMYVAPHDIKGVVYRDFDANGTRQNTATYAEPGVPGVTVTAYAADGTQAAQTTTGADGTYTLDIPAAGSYRVEFTGLQAGDFSGAFGAGSGTSVQFVSGGAQNVNLGVNYPAQYSSSKNPKIVTSGFINGNQGNADPYNNNAVVWTLPFNATGTLTSSGRSNISTANRLGAIWGLAYAKRTRSLYAAAFTKRYVGFGPEGAGAIYKMDFNTDHTNVSGNPTLFYKFDAAAVGTGIHGTLATTSGGDAADTEAFDKVGKSSLGDIDLSDDEKDLYVVTLGDRKLNRINVANASTPGSHVSFNIPVPARGTSDAAYTNDWRPFALKYHRGKVYVGVVTTNESSYTHSAYQSGGSAAAYNSDIGKNTGLKAEIFVFDPATNTFSSTPVLSFPLTYTKQPTSADQTGRQAGTAWRPWTSTYRLDREESLTTYSQAWLTDIEFDVNGDMVLGIRDRWGDQMGVQNRRPASLGGTAVGPGGATLVSSIAAGEVLRAGNNGNNTWTIENNGSVNGSTASTIQQDQNGPGGGKYYWGDRVGESGNHGSSSLGGLALLAGSGKLVMTAMDPTDVFNTGGIKRMINSGGFNNLRGNAGSAGAADDNLNNTGGSVPVPAATGNGTYKGAYLFASGSAPYWGKANGMGEVELLTDPAPIEIGNRIWRDTDGDGIQDAGEPGIADVTVELVDNNGAVVATAKTDANGNYIFSSDRTGTSTDALKYNLALVYGAQYKVRVPNVSGSSKQAALGTDRLTLANQGESNPNGDTRDSDGVAVENEAYAETALFTLGDAGENDHTHDFGFAPLGALGDYVWIDTDSDGIQDAGEEGINGVTVTLYKWNPTTEVFEAYGVPQQTRDNPNESGKKGYYWFGDLPSGEYKVQFTDFPAGYKLTNANQGGNDAQDSDADSEGWSQAVTIDTSKPETDLLRINPTIDAGIVPVGALGDYVWIDTDSDGIQDAGEEGINGVTVTLYKWNPTTETFEAYGVPQQTRDNPNESGKRGYYWFGDLPSGEYKVQFTDFPAGFKLTNANQGGNDAQDSDADIQGWSQAVTIDTSKPETDLLRINPTIDAGIVPVGALGDYVWIDTDSDGIQDAGEEGINGVTVTLYKWNPTTEVFEAYGVPQQTRNNPNDLTKKGYYWFGDLPSGQYQVGFSDLPAGFGFTDPDQGSEDAEDSDANPVTGRSQTVVINTSEPVTSLLRINPTIDAGIVPVGSIGDYVWFDADKDGEQDETEEGVNGVTVQLYKWNETTAEFVLEETTVTATNAGKDGYYNFTNLRTGKYKVKFVKPAGRDFTHKDKSGVDDAEDSDADRTTGESGEIDIDTSLPVANIGRNNPTIDAGLVPEGALPVRLAQFGVAKEGATAKLTWRTTSEVNASHFEVLRSADASTWAKIGTVAATGGENIVGRYALTDGSPVAGLNFYRLRTVDLDGTSELSHIVSADFSKGVAEAAFVYPNPTSGSIRFSNSLDLSRVKSVSVTDIRGNVVYTAGSISADGIPATRFRNGLHIIRVRMDDGTTRDFKVVIAPEK